MLNGRPFLDPFEPSVPSVLSRYTLAASYGLCLIPAYAPWIGVDSTSVLGP